MKYLVVLLLSRFQGWSRPIPLPQIEVVWLKKWCPLKKPALGFFESGLSADLAKKEEEEDKSAILCVI